MEQEKNWDGPLLTAEAFLKEKLLEKSKLSTKIIEQKNEFYL